jgi:hypothetical protein
MQNPDEMMALAVTAFQHWRTSRANRVVKTPPALQQQAAALRASFSSSKIMKALSVSGTNLKRWSSQKQTKHSLIEFVALPSINEPQPAPLSLELAFTNGCHLRLCGDISPAMLTAITQSVAASSRALS